MHPMDDAELVEAARSGDDGAWAAIYDRYADKLHDHCHRLLHDRYEAADALHDAFIKASRNLHQLRDPSRLRPWLYSICRHEALRRARQRSRVELTDEVDDMNTVEIDMEGGTSAAELQELVWAAAAGLNERDQALLDLNLRQGLEGQDLADAMGTSLSNSYVLMSRLRDQVERSLGALLIARLGRDDCQELDGILDGWDGRFTPLLRKRVARHVDRCSVCSDGRASALSPLALLAAAPLMPAPADLRSRVLDGIAGGAAPADPEVLFTEEGFAAPPPGTDVVRRRPWWLAAVAAVVALLVAGTAIAVAGQDGDKQPDLVAAESEPDDTTTTTADEEETTTTDSPTTTEPTTTSTPDVAVPTTQPENQTPTTNPDVALPPPTTAPADTTKPTIGPLSSSAPEIALDFPECNVGTPRRTTISAAVSDASPVTVVLSWNGDAGSGQVPMALSGGRYRASFGSFTNEMGVGGDVTYTVRATDAAGNTATRSGTIFVEPCPQ